MANNSFIFKISPCGRCLPLALSPLWDEITNSLDVVVSMKTGRDLNPQ
jgi:hypothetical protein